MRRTTRTCLLMCLVLGVFAVGCTPRIPPIPDTTGWTLALEDDFSDPESGFARDEYGHGRWFYEDGRYGIEVTKENWGHHTERGEFADFAAEVELSPEQDAGCAGLVFRTREAGTQYYNFIICPSGEYTLEKLLSYQDEEAAWETLLPWRESSHIHTGLATNRIQVVAVGSRIWIAANDQLLGSVEDTSFSQGAIGMQVFKYTGDGPVIYYFDNLRVYVPKD